MSAPSSPGRGPLDPPGRDPVEPQGRDPIESPGPAPSDRTLLAPAPPDHAPFDRAQSDPDAPGHPASRDLAAALDLVGARWALLIVERLLDGPQRYGDLQRDLALGTNILATRLRELEETGILVRLPLKHNTRAYALTARGQSLRDAIVALGRWGADAPPPADPPASADAPAPAPGDAARPPTLRSEG